MQEQGIDGRDIRLLLCGLKPTAIFSESEAYITGRFRPWGERISLD